MYDPEKEAADTLVHYFRKVFEAAGLTLDSDGEMDIRGVIDDVIDAAVMRAVEPGNK